MFASRGLCGGKEIFKLRKQFLYTVSAELNKVAAEKRMCPPEGTLTGFFYQND